MIYLDYAASSPVRIEALEALTKSSRIDFANPASSHKLGSLLSKKIDEVREEILTLLGIKRGYRVVFLSSATEANNLIIKGLDLKRGDHILISQADHPSIKVPAYQLMEQGIVSSCLEHTSLGLIDEDQLFKRNFLTEKLLALSFVNNQSGHVFQINEIARHIKEKNRNFHIHVDAVQAIGKIKVDMSDMQIDSLTISGHKIGGPKGIAILVMKEGVNLKPQIVGGGQEYGLRSSTLSAPLIFSFLEAFKCAINRQAQLIQKLSAFKDYLEEQLPKCCPEIIFPFSKKLTSEHILTFIVPKISSDILIRHLEMKEIYLSSTSACSSKNIKDNEVFLALGIKNEYHQNVIRLSMGEETTLDELSQFVSEFGVVYKDLIRFRGK